MVAVDVSNVEAVEKVSRGIEEEFGPIDLTS